MPDPTPPPPQSHQRIRELFDQAMALPGPQREAFIRDAAGANQALATEVLALIAGVTQAPEVVVRPAHTAATVGVAAGKGPEDVFRRGAGPMGEGFNLLDAIRSAADEPAPAHHPTQVGSYRIIRPIDDGGFGVVYLAEQASPRREVALKLIKPELGAGALRRFADEARVLARLQHPGIAQIYEAGMATLDGRERAYFAMEYIRGSRLDQFVASRVLDTRQRLQLLASICHAVQHAHQKGIVHRDLKPANILVDEAGNPKVIDFGVARLTDRDFQATTRQTRVGDRIGTLYYMSPEQIAGDPDDLDTRSDVYALGVIGYELLAGRLPYDLSAKAEFEVARMIRDDAPSRLSSISRIFRGDIETIIDKALAKEKDRRYTSAAALAADIERYLRDEPIEARGPGAWYQARKFAARNKGFVATLAASMLALLVGVGGLVWGVGESRLRSKTDLVARYSRLANQLRQNFTPETLVAIDEALASTPAPEDVPLRLLRIEALDALNKSTEAQREVATLASRDDLGQHRAEALLWLGDVNLASAAGGLDAKQCIASIHQAIELGLSTSEENYAQALVASDVDGSRGRLEAAVAADPRHIRAQNLLAFIEALSGDHEQALARARMVSILAPKHPNPLLVQGISLTFLDRPDGLEPIMERLRTLLDAESFSNLRIYFRLAATAVKINKSGRPQAALSQLIKEVLPFVKRAQPRSSAATDDTEILLRMPGFIATDFSINRVIAVAGALMSPLTDQAESDRLLSSLRRLGPGVRAMLDAHAARKAYDRGDYDETERLALLSLNSPQLIDVRADLSNIYLLALHQRWRRDGDPGSLKKLTDAAPLCVAQWNPETTNAVYAAGILVDLGMNDQALLMLNRIDQAFPDDQTVRRDLLYHRLRLADRTNNAPDVIRLATRFLDAAKPDDGYRPEIMAMLKKHLDAGMLLPERDGRPQTDAELRRRYGVAPATGS